MIGTAVGIGFALTLDSGTAAAFGTTIQSKFLAQVRTRLGCPYLFGAEGPNEFDCSGLVYWGWKQVGRTVPRTADAQYKAAKPLTASLLRPGDSVFFVNSSGVAKHTLIYAGSGMYYQASDLYSANNCVEYVRLPSYSGKIAYGRLVSQ